jgi:hypothetical protein
MIGSCIVLNLVTRVNDDESDEFTPGRGLRQGCVLSGMLFNIYLLAVIEKVNRQLEPLDCCIKLRAIKEDNDFRWPGCWLGRSTWRSFRWLAYADDICLLCSSFEQLRRVAEILEEELSRAGLAIGYDKTKFMVLNARDTPDELILRFGRCSKVSSFKYLGCLLNETVDDTSEIRSRIGTAGAAMMELMPFLRSRLATASTKIKVASALALSKLMYNAETWCIKASEEDMVNACQRRLQRYAAGIFYPDIISNSDLLQLFPDSVDLATIIRRRQLQWTGHIYRMPACNPTRHAFFSAAGKHRGRRRSARKDIAKILESTRVTEANNRDTWRRIAFLAAATSSNHRPKLLSCRGCGKSYAAAGWLQRHERTCMRP